MPMRFTLKPVLEPSSETVVKKKNTSALTDLQESSKGEGSTGAFLPLKEQADLVLAEVQFPGYERMSGVCGFVRGVMGCAGYDGMSGV